MWKLFTFLNEESSLAVSFVFTNTIPKLVKLINFTFSFLIFIFFYLYKTDLELRSEDIFKNKTTLTRIQETLNLLMSATSINIINDTNEND